MPVLSGGSPVAKATLKDFEEAQQHQSKPNKRVHSEGVPITIPAASDTRGAASESLHGGPFPFSKKQKISRPSFSGPPVEDEAIDLVKTAQSSLSFSEKIAQAKAMSAKRSPSDGEKRAAALLTSLIPDLVFDQARASVPHADEHDLLLSAAYLVILSQSQANIASQLEMVTELSRISQAQTLRANLLERENAQLKARLGDEKRGVGRPKKEKAKPEPSFVIPPSRALPDILLSGEEIPVILPPKKTTATDTGTEAMEKQLSILPDHVADLSDSDTTNGDEKDKKQQTDGSVAEVAQEKTKNKGKGKNEQSTKDVPDQVRARIEQLERENHLLRIQRGRAMELAESD